MKYDFDEIINRKNTYSEKWDYQGGDYLPMWVADMDFRSPEPLVQALLKRVEHGVFGYTENEWQLNEVVISYYRSRYHVEIPAEWIVWVSSVMAGANVACRMAGGDILYSVPMYTHIRKLADEIHRKAVEVDLCLSKKNGKLFYTQDTNALETAMTEEITTFLLCNPHNPVGRVYTKEELQQISVFCKKHNLLLVSDEIHSELILEGTHTPAFLVDDWAREHSITFTSAAKTYNIPSLPTAFAIIPNKELRERYRDALNGLVPAANPLTITAIRSAYTECTEWKEELLAYLKKNRDYLEKWADGLGIPITHIEGTYLPWMDLRGYFPDKDAWAVFRQKAGVNYGDGAEYGREGFLRVNIGCPFSQLKEALDRTEAVLREPLAELAPFCRSAAAQGAVLLKNEDGMLPIREEDHVALFGRCQIDYYRSGTGSGGLVNVPYTTGLLEGLRRFSWVKLNEPLAKIYESWVEAHPFDRGDGAWASEPWYQEEMPLSEDLVREASAVSNKAIIVIGRTAGEDKDNAEEPGSYLLTDQEERMVSLVTKYFTRTAVVFNVSNIMDMRFTEGNPHLKALLYTWHGGMEGGNAAADLLTGEVNPSGHLTDTIARTLKAYPSDRGYGHRHTDIYDEDIYVGYRFFETFGGDEVLYPFGYGLSYTSFSRSVRRVWTEGEGVNTRIGISVDVTNTGDCAGREVIQVYVGAPMGRLGKPAKVLVNFEKTNLLAPGETQTLTLVTGLNRFASYDDSGITGHRSCYVLEEGEYRFYVGTDCRNAEEVSGDEGSVFCLKELLVLESLQEACAPVMAYKRLTARQNPDTGHVEAVYEDTPLRSTDLSERIRENLPVSLTKTAEKTITFQDVKAGKASLASFTAQLSERELAAIVRAEGMCSAKVTPGTAAAFGGVTQELVNRGIPVACASDGPSGIRMDTGQQATQLPIGTLLACSFDPRMVEELFYLEGKEMRLNQVDTLLGPGVNIHRHPLNGRNFEYFSEDPYVTGVMAVACVRGLKRAGVTGTVKHFACNNQEKERHKVNAVVSERAIREIYLKGFEMAVKEGGASSIMTTYAPLNGCQTSCCYDLNTTVLRGEWGYRGIVMTDWWAKLDDVLTGGNPNDTDTASMIRAQNDLYMVVGNNGAEINVRGDNTLEALAQGRLTIGELQRNAMNILRFLLQSPASEREVRPQHPIKIQPLTQDVPADCEVSEYRVDLGRLAEEDALYVQIAKDGLYGINVELMSEKSPQAQMLTRLLLNGEEASNIQTNGTNGNWMVQRICKAELKAGIYEVSLKHIRPGIVFSHLEFVEELSPALQEEADRVH